MVRPSRSHHRPYFFLSPENLAFILAQIPVRSLKLSLEYSLLCKLNNRDMSLKMREDVQEKMGEAFGEGFEYR